jgi:hypothetical protein
MFTVEENGSASCELALNSHFVLVRVPLRLGGEGERGEVTFHYGIGSFAGREITVALGAGGHTTLRFRIPEELFRPRAHLAVEVLARSGRGPQKLQWAKRWEVAWQGKAPHLEPIAD